MIYLDLKYVSLSCMALRHVFLRYVPLRYMSLRYASLRYEIAYAKCQKSDLILQVLSRTVLSTFQN
jgi:hypothetical protein